MTDPHPYGATRLLWSLRENVSVEQDDDGVVLRGGIGEVRIDEPLPAVAAALQRMKLGPVRLGNVPLAEGPAGAAEDEQLRAVLADARAFVVRSIACDDGGGPLLSVVPMSADATFEPVTAPEATRLRLSRFALQQPAGRDGLSLTSPLSTARVSLHRPEASWLVNLLSAPRTAAQLVDLTPLPADLVRTMLAFLLGSGLAVLEQDGGFAEDLDPALRLWSPWELMAYVHGGIGDHDDEADATFPLTGRFVPAAPESAVAGERIALPSAGAARGAGLDLAELSGVLAGAENQRRAWQQPRPPGCAGNSSELRVYVVVRDCAGLPAGAYLYDPNAHELIRRDGADEARAGLLSELGAQTGRPEGPPVLLIVTSRILTILANRPSGALTMTLRNAGRLLHALYLAAHRRGLPTTNTHAVDVRASAQTLGLDWHEETMVAALILGVAGQPEGES